MNDSSKKSERGINTQRRIKQQQQIFKYNNYKKNKLNFLNNYQNNSYDYMEIINVNCIQIILYIFLFIIMITRIDCSSAKAGKSKGHTIKYPTNRFNNLGGNGFRFNPDSSNDNCKY